MLRSAPWRRAPLLLLKSPGVLLACVLAAAVLSMAAASGVLFLASTGTAALHSEAAQECPESSQPGITNDLGPDHYPSAQQDPSALLRADGSVRAAMASARLPSADLVSTASVAVGSDRAGGAMLFARAGALAHVQVLRSVGGAGVWIPQTFAASHGVRAGSTLALGRGQARVAGVYRDLAPSAFVPLFALPRYWCTWQADIVPTPFNLPAPLFLTDVSTLTALASTIDSTWYAPVPIGHETVPRARAAEAASTTALATLAAHRLTQYRATSDLPYLLAKADRVRAGLAGPVVPIDVAGTLVAALLVAAAGTFWGLRRKRELTLLSSRGVGRLGLGIKAVVETGLAIAVGTVAGWLLALVLVRSLGPSSLLEPGAPLLAFGLSAAVGAAALVAVGVTGARAIPADRVRHPVAWARRVPWELTLLATSVLAYRQVRSGGAVHVVKATVQVSPMVLAFPLLALTGAVLLLGRAGEHGLRRSGALARRLPVVGYLALRRLSGSPAVAIGTLIGVALPIGVLIYSSALAGSTAADVRAKQETNVGAEVAFGTLAAPGSTPDVAGRGTIVSMIQIDPVIDDGTQVRIIGIDPATFASYAFHGSALRATIALLTDRAGPLATVLVNAPSHTNVHSVQIRGVTVPLHVVATRASFPGLRDPYEPLLVVNRAALPKLAPYTDRTEELWTTQASVSATLAALAHDGVDPNYEITTQTFLDNTGLRPVTWIFGYLQALAYLTGLVAFAGLTFAFTARTRRRALSYQLERRMGLSRVRHRRSIAIELGALLALSWAAGTALAMGAVALVYRLTDAYPALPPPPDLPAPVATLVATAGVAVATGFVGTWALQRALDRIAPSELLRA